MAEYVRESRKKRDWHTFPTRDRNMTVFSYNSTDNCEQCINTRSHTNTPYGWLVYEFRFVHRSKKKTRLKIRATACLAECETVWGEKRFFPRFCLDPLFALRVFLPSDRHAHWTDFISTKVVRFQLLYAISLFTRKLFAPIFSLTYSLSLLAIRHRGPFLSNEGNFYLDFIN